ncbi:MAG: N-acetyltransferase [Thermoproteota archaeon]|nr:N-acetyltransferase [Thermoproteota archaeon]
MSIVVMNMKDEHLRYVSLCTHTDEKENSECLQAADMRLQWLKDAAKRGMKTEVAINEKGEPLGFIHMVPIKSPCSGMIGRDLMVIPCLTINYQLVYKRLQGTGVGRALVQACEKEARKRKFKGLAVYAYSGDFWFMPSLFFQKLGFERIPSTNIWIKKWDEVEDPKEPTINYKYVPIPGKVVIDYFWSPSCLTTCQEAINIRDVVSEFESRVVLNTHRADDPEIFKNHGLIRALYINGKRKDWGYAAPKDALRKEIADLLETI